MVYGSWKNHLLISVLNTRLIVITIAVFLLCSCMVARAAGVGNIFDARIPMRDGVKLSADIWLPAQDGRYPALLMRTPYVKSRAGPHMDFYAMMRNFADQDYVALYQDVRGRGDSDGVFHADGEGNDGIDTIKWIARQPWSNGSVCMFGPGYMALAGVVVALQTPQNLKCIVATSIGATWSYFYVGEAFSLENIPVYNVYRGRTDQRDVGATLDWNRIFSHRPLLTLDKAAGADMPLYQRVLNFKDPMADVFLNRRLVAEDYRKIDLPVLHVTGWFDSTLGGALDFWDTMAAHSPAKNKQYLLIGPWGHTQPFVGGTTRLGELEFTDDSVVDIMALHVRFFAHYLKGKTEKFDFPRVRLYITGSNMWRDFDNYPPSNSRDRRLFLHSGSHANSLAGDGWLDWQVSDDGEPADTYIYDPQKPVPAGVGDPPQQVAGDQRSIEQREDVLVYTGEILTEPLEVIGRVTVELYAATDRRDTDFTAKLIDVYPDGRAVKMGMPKSGVIRARYRNGFGREELLTPGKVEKYVIDMSHIGHTFLPDHRIRIEISSSAYPMVNPNQNTGNPIATDTEWRVARQSIHHDKVYPSAVILPVFEGEVQSKRGN
jgi:hypothetical protein